MFILNGMVLFLIKWKWQNNKCWFLSSSERWRNILCGCSRSIECRHTCNFYPMWRPEEFINDSNGILIPKDDSSAMAEAIVKCKQHIIDLTDRWLVKCNSPFLFNVHLYHNIWSCTGNFAHTLLTENDQLSDTLRKVFPGVSVDISTIDS